MLMRDPFRDLDRLTQQAFGTPGRPATMPLDAWREGDAFFVAFDLPGVDKDSIDLTVERNVLSVRAERAALNRDQDMLAAERPRGVFSRQVIVGDNLDTDHLQASYEGGVLTLRLPIAERAKPRRITIDSAERAASAHDQRTLASAT